jgi:hypothetical protein
MTDAEKQLALEAKQVLESPAFHHVLGVVSGTYRKQSEESEHDQQALREHCYLMVKALKELHRELTVLAVKGKLDIVRHTRGGNSSAA